MKRVNPSIRSRGAIEEILNPAYVSVRGRIGRSSGKRGGAYIGGVPTGDPVARTARAGDARAACPTGFPASKEGRASSDPSDTSVNPSVSCGLLQIGGTTNGFSQCNGKA